MVQEIAAAEHVIVHCGEDYADWRTMFGDRLACTRDVKNNDYVDGLPARFSSYASLTEQAFADLVEAFTYRYHSHALDGYRFQVNEEHPRHRTGATGFRMRKQA